MTCSSLIQLALHQHFPCMLTRSVGNSDTAQHTRDFVYSFGSSKWMNLAEDLVILLRFADLQMMLAEGGDLR